MTENPYALLRQKAGLNQTQFCAKHHLARQTLVAIERGVYPTLSDRMIVELGKACHAAGVDAAQELSEAFGVRTLSEAYAIWRREDRIEQASGVNSIEPDRWSPALSPMRHLVLEFGRGTQGFSKAMKVPSATLIRYMEGRQREMPESIEVAFREIGYPNLRQLIERQAAWADEHGSA